MEVRFRLFASLSEMTGTTAGTMELPSDATVRNLWEALGARFPALAGVGFVPMISCDMEYAGWDHPLEGVDEVGFLPPVSGG